RGAGSKGPGAYWPELRFFFFQAEDGIRDGHVTGVQTCALPILEEPDCRDIVVAPNRLAEPRPRSCGVPEKHDAGPEGSASAMDSRCCDLLVTLAYASGSPHETGGDGGAGDANGYAA